MTTIYRSIFTDSRPDLTSASRDLFSSWLQQKGVEVELPQNGTVAAKGGEVGVTAVEVADDGLKAHRLRLDEEAEGARWTTILTTIESPAERWVWIDLERVSEDAYGPPPKLAPPRLVRMFLENGTSSLGPTILRPAARQIDETEIDRLLEELLEPERRVPILVASRDRQDIGAEIDRAKALSSVLLGVANVWVLGGLATTELSKEIGPDLHVFGGAVRTYFPGLTVPDRYPLRHRFAHRDLFAPPPRGAQVVGRAIISKAAGTRPPLIYRERVANLPGFARHGGHSDALLADLLAAEEERDRLRDNLELTQMETDLETARADTAEARVRWLTEQLEEHGQYAAAQPTPSAHMGVTITGCVDALQRAAELRHVVIGDTIEPAEELDQFPKARTWGKKAWDALRALESYADARAAGKWDGGFSHSAANIPRADKLSLSTGWPPLKATRQQRILVSSAPGPSLSRKVQIRMEGSIWQSTSGLKKVLTPPPGSIFSMTQEERLRASTSVTSVVICRTLALTE